MYRACQFTRRTHAPANFARCFAGIVAPGRLGNPRLTVGTDPRVDIRQKQMLTELGLHVHGKCPISLESTWDEKLAFAKASHDGWSILLKGAESGFTVPKGTTASVETIKDGAGGDMAVSIAKPDSPGPHPVLLWMHGSGFICFSPLHPLEVALQAQTAQHNAIVIAPDFRKVGVVGEAGRFPGPLDDCLATLEWIHANMEQLGGDGSVIAVGADGGASIACAMALKLNAAGEMAKLNGVFAMGPWLYGRTDENPDFLNSCEENRDYVIANEQIDVCYDIYDGGGSDHPENLTNAFSRPYYATVEQMKGLCPHAFTFNECGQARDECASYVRKLKEAGVRTNARIICGSTLAGQTIAGSKATEMFEYTARTIAGFAHHGVRTSVE